MTKCKPKRPALKRLRRRAVDVNFNGGTLTSDGGLRLLREVDRRLGLIERIDAIIPDPQDPFFTAHPQAEMLTSRVFGIAAGYEDGNDHQQLRHDPAFQVAAARVPAQNQYDNDEHFPLASPSTLCRLENRVSDKVCLKLHEVLVDTFLDSHEQPPEEIILDIDATDDLVHGNRSRWPNVKIILRGDSGFANERLMRWCDKHDVGYVFGFQKNSVLNREITCEMTRARIRHGHLGGTKACCFKWFRYRAVSWDRHRWMIGKTEFGTKGANPRFVVTNLPSSEGIVDTTYHRRRIDGKQVECIKELGTQCSVAREPESFYRRMYCPRGEMENRIKEKQLCLFADRTSCMRFVANQFRLLLSSFAYVLTDGLRRLGLAGSVQSRWRIDTIRLRLLKIAGRVRVSHRRVEFALASGCPAAGVFNAVLGRLIESG